MELRIPVKATLPCCSEGICNRVFLESTWKNNSNYKHLLYAGLINTASVVLEFLYPYEIEKRACAKQGEQCLTQDLRRKA